MTIKTGSTTLAVGLVLLAAGAAQAAITTALASPLAKVGSGQAAGLQGGGAGALVVDVTGTPSIDALNDAPNVRWAIDAAPGALVDAISYQLTLETVGPSWLSEATVLITNSAGSGITLRPGHAADVGGRASFSGSASLSALNMAFNIGADGRLNVQFYEDYDDVVGSADALFTAGSITLGGLAVSPVPEPGRYGLMALGLLALAPRLRRHKG